MFTDPHRSVPIRGWPAGSRKGAGYALLVAIDRPTRARVSTVLSGLGLSLLAVDDAESALTILEAEDVRMVWCNYPLPRLLLRHFLSRLRSPACKGRFCGVVVLSIPELLSGANRFLSNGANAVLPKWAPTAALTHTARKLLEIAPRYRLAETATIRVESPDGLDVPVEGVANISTTGMLLLSPERPSLGTECVAELASPELSSPIRLRLRVVRHAQLAREGLKGFAVQFSPPVADVPMPLPSLTE